MPDLQNEPSASLIGNPFIILESVESTNNYAMARINAGQVREGTVYLARKQTAGKGQRGKSWLSADQLNITLSVVLQPVMIHPSAQFLLSAAVSLGTCDLLMQYADPGKCRIKWSNDIFWNDRKAGGILIENTIRGNQWSYAVAGIGLNINQVLFPEELPNPVSLKAITGKHLDILTVARELCTCLEIRYNQLRLGLYGEILEEYAGRLYLLNRPARFKTGTLILDGVIKGVSPDGKLKLETGNMLREFDFGELELLNGQGSPPEKS